MRTRKRTAIFVQWLKAIGLKLSSDMATLTTQMNVIKSMCTL